MNNPSNAKLATTAAATHPAKAAEVSIADALVPVLTAYIPAAPASPSAPAAPGVALSVAIAAGGTGTRADVAAVGDTATEELELPVGDTACDTVAVALLEALQEAEGLRVAETEAEGLGVAVPVQLTVADGDALGSGGISQGKSIYVFQMPSSRRLSMPATMLALESAVTASGSGWGPPMPIFPTRVTLALGTALSVTAMVMGSDHTTEDAMAMETGALPSTVVL